MSRNLKVQLCSEFNGYYVMHVDSRTKLPGKTYYQAFFWVLIDLIVELLGLIIKSFDNQTES
jgi:hypothetical protein